MTHSMSGPYGWKLLEQYGDYVAKIVAVAPGPPGNIQPAATITNETPEKLEVRGTTNYTLDRKAPFVATPAFVSSKLIGKSTQFPREHTARYAASLQPIAPRLLQQRLNIGGAQMKVTDFSRYRGKRALVLIGTDDVDHPRELHFSIGRIAITYLALNLLMPDRRNPRQHSPPQIRQISLSIEIFGFVVPILIDRNNYIVAGEGRYRASEYLGWL